MTRACQAGDARRVLRVVTATTASPRQLRLTGAPVPPLREVAGWTLGLASVTLLAFQGGGYDPVVLGQVGVAIWWIVVFGVAAGVLTRRLSRAGMVVALLILAFAVWTGLSATWSESAERSVAELSRTATYGGALLLALLATRELRAGAILDGVGAGVAVVGVLAFLSWLKPGWFPTDDLAVVFADDPHRLSYPLNYWNGLAALLAIGLPCLLRMCASARLLAVRAAAGSVVPLLLCAVFFTGSRGGVVALGVSLTAWLILVPGRLTQLLVGAAIGLPAAVLVLAAHARDDLTKGLGTPLAQTQGDELLWIALLVAAATAFLVAAATLVARHAELPALSIRPSRWALAALAVLTLGAAAAGTPALLDRWDEFKAPPEQAQSSARASVATRLGSASGNGRYQSWEAAWAQFSHRPAGGTGAGTFEYWWARHPRTTEYVRSAHNQYLQALGETGLVGGALFAGGLLAAAGFGARRRIRARGTPDQATALAAALAGFATFLVALAYDWIWLIPVIPVTALLLAAVAIQGREPPAIQLGAARARVGNARLGTRVALIALGLAGVAAVTVPFAAGRDLRRSQAQFRDARPAAALRSAATAARLQPYAASPLLQQALILEAQGALDRAIPKIEQATRREPTNWRLWFVRARILGKAGQAGAADAAATQARRLNPNSRLVAE